MFERYTEKARRVIFVARHEAVKAGSPSIETEHLLLGFLREDQHNARAVLKSEEVAEIVRQEMERLQQKRYVSVVDPPFSAPSKRAIVYAAEECDAVQSKVINARHLLLGLLREEGGLAAQILNRLDVRLDDVRQLPDMPGETPSPDRRALHALVDWIPEDRLSEALEHARGLASRG